METPSRRVGGLQDGDESPALLSGDEPDGVGGGVAPAFVPAFPPVASPTVTGAERADEKPATAGSKQPLENIPHDRSKHRGSRRSRVTRASGGAGSGASLARSTLESETDVAVGRPKRGGTQTTDRYWPPTGMSLDDSESRRAQLATSRDPAHAAEHREARSTGNTTPPEPRASLPKTPPPSLPRAIFPGSTNRQTRGYPVEHKYADTEPAASSRGSSSRESTRKLLAEARRFAAATDGQQESKATPGGSVIDPSSGPSSNRGAVSLPISGYLQDASPGEAVIRAWDSGVVFGEDGMSGIGLSRAQATPQRRPSSRKRRAEAIRRRQEENWNDSMGQSEYHGSRRSGTVQVSKAAGIPPYDAVSDPHNTYTQSKSFMRSPFVREMTSGPAASRISADSGVMEGRRKLLEADFEALSSSAPAAPLASRLASSAATDRFASRLQGVVGSEVRMKSEAASDKGVRSYGSPRIWADDGLTADSVPVGQSRISPSALQVDGSSSLANTLESTTLQSVSGNLDSPRQSCGTSGRRDWSATETLQGRSPAPNPTGKPGATMLPEVLPKYSSYRSSSRAHPARMDESVGASVMVRDAGDADSAPADSPSLNAPLRGQLTKIRSGASRTAIQSDARRYAHAMDGRGAASAAEETERVETSHASEFTEHQSASARHNVQEADEAQLKSAHARAIALSTHHPQSLASLDSIGPREGFLASTDLRNTESVTAPRAVDHDIAPTSPLETRVVSEADREAIRKMLFAPHGRWRVEPSPYSPQGTQSLDGRPRSRSRSGSPQGTRARSRPGSRTGSRPGSKPRSRSGSRSGVFAGKPAAAVPPAILGSTASASRMIGLPSINRKYIHESIQSEAVLGAMNANELWAFVTRKTGMTSEMLQMLVDSPVGANGGPDSVTLACVQAWRVALAPAHSCPVPQNLLKWPILLSWMSRTGELLCDIARATADSVFHDRKVLSLDKFLESPAASVRVVSRTSLPCAIVVQWLVALRPERDRSGRALPDMRSAEAPTSLLYGGAEAETDIEMLVSSHAEETSFESVAGPPTEGSERPGASMAHRGIQSSVRILESGERDRVPRRPWSADVVKRAGVSSRDASSTSFRIRPEVDPEIAAVRAEVRKLQETLSAVKLKAERTEHMEKTLMEKQMVLEKAVEQKHNTASVPSHVVHQLETSGTDRFAQLDRPDGHDTHYDSGEPLRSKDTQDSELSRMYSTRKKRRLCSCRCKLKGQPMLVEFEVGATKPCLMDPIAKLPGLVQFAATSFVGAEPHPLTVYASELVLIASAFADLHVWSWNRSRVTTTQRAVLSRILEYAFVSNVTLNSSHRSVVGSAQTHIRDESNVMRLMEIPNRISVCELSSRDGRAARVVAEVARAAVTFEAVELNAGGEDNHTIRRQRLSWLSFWRLASCPAPPDTSDWIVSAAWRSRSDHVDARKGTGSLRIRGEESSVHDPLRRQPEKTGTTDEAPEPNSEGAADRRSFEVSTTTDTCTVDDGGNPAVESSAPVGPPAIVAELSSPICRLAARFSIGDSSARGSESTVVLRVNRLLHRSDQRISGIDGRVEIEARSSGLHVQAILRTTSAAGPAAERDSSASEKLKQSGAQTRLRHDVSEKELRQFIVELCSRSPPDLSSDTSDDASQSSGEGASACADESGDPTLERLLQPHRIQFLCQLLAADLVLVSDDGVVLLDAAATTSAGGHIRLRLAQHRARTVMQVALNNATTVVGAIEVSTLTTLQEARAIVNEEFDAGTLPADFRFLYCGAPCSFKQESKRRAVECAPVLVLLEQEPVADAEDAQVTDSSLMSGNSFNSEGTSLPGLDPPLRRSESRSKATAWLEGDSIHDSMVSGDGDDLAESLPSLPSVVSDREAATDPRGRKKVLPRRKRIRRAKKSSRPRDGVTESSSTNAMVITSETDATSQATMSELMSEASGAEEVDDFATASLESDSRSPSVSLRSLSKSPSALMELFKRQPSAEGTVLTPEATVDSVSEPEESSSQAQGSSTPQRAGPAGLSLKAIGKLAKLKSKVKKKRGSKQGRKRQDAHDGSATSTKATGGVKKLKRAMKSVAMMKASKRKKGQQKKKSGPAAAVEPIKKSKKHKKTSKRSLDIEEPTSVVVLEQPISVSSEDNALRAANEGTLFAWLNSYQADHGAPHCHDSQYRVIPLPVKVTPQTGSVDVATLVPLHKLFKREDKVRIGADTFTLAAVTQKRLVLSEAYLGHLGGHSAPLFYVEDAAKLKEPPEHVIPDSRLEELRDLPLGSLQFETGRFFRVTLALAQFENLIGTVGHHKPDDWIDRLDTSRVLPQLWVTMAAMPTASTVVGYEKVLSMLQGCPHYFGAYVTEKMVREAFTVARKPSKRHGNNSKRLTRTSSSHGTEKSHKPEPKDLGLLQVNFVDTFVPMLAEMRYKHLPREEAMKQLIAVHLSRCRALEEFWWTEAKRAALLAECKYMCAAHKLQAWTRGCRDRERITMIHRMARRISGMWTGFKCRQWVKLALHSRQLRFIRGMEIADAESTVWNDEANELSRIYLSAMTVCQAAERDAMEMEDVLSMQRLRYEREMEREAAARIHMRSEDAFMRKFLIDEQKHFAKQQRAARAERCRLMRAATVFVETRRINGTLNTIRFVRTSREGNTLFVYTPETQQTHQFSVSEVALTPIVSEGLRTEWQACGRPMEEMPIITRKNLYLRQHVAYLVDRLMYVTKRGKRTLKLSKRVEGNRGRVLFKRAKRLSGRAYVVTVALQQGQYVINAYWPERAATWTYGIPQSTVFSYFKVTPQTPPALLPSILSDGHEVELALYLLDKVGVCDGRDCLLQTHVGAHRAGRHVLMLDFEVHEQERLAHCLRIQLMVRQMLARRELQRRLASVFEQHYDRVRERFVFVNVRTGEMSLTKPTRLGRAAVALAPDEWRTQRDASTGATIFYHPLTGRYSCISEADAARAVQRMFRSRKLRDFRVTDMRELVRSLRFQMETEENYRRKPEGLGQSINYALLLHAVKRDMGAAKTAWAQAILRGHKHPVCLFGYGVFKLAHCEYPRRRHWADAQEMLLKARELDPSGESFAIAERNFFRWGVVIDPQSCQAMANYAIVQQVVYGEYDRAEKLYHVALHLDPTDTKVQQNFDELVSCHCA